MWASFFIGFIIAGSQSVNICELEMGIGEAQKGILTRINFACIPLSPLGGVGERDNGLVQISCYEYY